MAIRDIRRANLRWLIDNQYDGVESKLARETGIHPSQISRIVGPGAKGVLGDTLARRIEERTGKPEGWMDELHLFAALAGGDPGALGRAVVVSPFGHRMVPVVPSELAAQWLAATAPYPLTERTQVDWIRMEQAGERTLGMVIEREDMRDDIWPGDVVFLDPDVSPQPGDYVLAQVEDINEEHAAVFRKYRPRRRDSAGVLIVELAPLNDDYPTYVIDAEHSGRILGVMVEHRKYRRRGAAGLPAPELRKTGGRTSMEPGG
jgi:SOS-response transcriptional repressor LexA